MKSRKSSQEKWERRIQALSSFTQREGHALVPSTHIERGTKLGSWVSYLRAQKHNGKLPPEKIEQLETFEGWDWGPLRPGPKTDTKRNEEIRHLYSTTQASLSELAHKFGVSRQRIHQIVGSENE